MSQSPATSNLERRGRKSKEGPKKRSVPCVPTTRDPTAPKAEAKDAGASWCFDDRDPRETHPGNAKAGLAYRTVDGPTAGPFPMTGDAATTESFMNRYGAGEFKAAEFPSAQETAQYFASQDSDKIIHKFGINKLLQQPRPYVLKVIKEFHDGLKNDDILAFLQKEGRHPSLKSQHMSDLRFKAKSWTFGHGCIWRWEGHERKDGTQKSEHYSWKVVVPRHNYHQVLCLAHQKAGHKCRDTFAQLQEMGLAHFGLTKDDANNFVKACPTCKKKPPRANPAPKGVGTVGKTEAASLPGQNRKRKAPDMETGDEEGQRLSRRPCLSTAQAPMPSSTLDTCDDLTAEPFQPFGMGSSPTAPSFYQAPLYLDIQYPFQQSTFESQEWTGFSNSELGPTSNWPPFSGPHDIFGNSQGSNFPWPTSQCGAASATVASFNLNADGMQLGSLLDVNSTIADNDTDYSVDTNVGNFDPCADAGIEDSFNEDFGLFEEPEPSILDHCITGTIF